MNSLAGYLLTLCIFIVTRTQESQGIEVLCRNMGCNIPGVSTIDTFDQPITGQIVGGEPATLIDFPHQVLLAIPACDSEGNWSPWKKLCGGSILDKSTILTAAHCIIDVPEMYWSLINVYAGITNFVSITKGQGQKSPVQTVEVHPQFPIYRNEGHYDVALLKLVAPFTFNRHVNYVYLPSPGTTFKSTAQVSGWGITNQRRYGDPKADQSIVLRKVTLDLITNERCQQYFDNYPSTEPDYHKIKDTRIWNEERCTHTPGKGACFGDSGGPLTCTHEGLIWNTDYLCGVVSYSYGCAWPGIPGVYVDVASTKINQWIVQTMKGFGATIYQLTSEGFPAITKNDSKILQTVNQFIRFYQDRDYGGNMTGQFLDVNGECQNAPDWINDKISSIQLNKNCIKVFTGPNCEGSSVQFQPGSRGHQFTGDVGMAGRISSFKKCTTNESFIPSNMEYVRFYEHNKFNGTFYRAPLGTNGQCQNVTNWMNDQISSIDTEGHCVITFEDINCNGASLKIHLSSALDLRENGFNDLISSYRKCTQEEHQTQNIEHVYMFEHANFKGGFFKGDVGSSTDCKTVPRWINDLTSSVNTEGHCISFFEHGGCQGKLIVLRPGTKSHYRMSDVDMDDKISSYRRCNDREWNTPEQSESIDTVASVLKPIACPVTPLGFYVFFKIFGVC